MSGRVSAILLAAGRSRRMGADKLALRYAGEPLIRRALAPLVDCPLIDEVIVVAQPEHGLPLAGVRCTVVASPEHDEGMGASLRAGVRAAAATADAYLIALGDMPLLTAELVRALVDAYFAARQPILVPVYEGQQGHPVIISAALRDELLVLGGDVGARELLRERAGEVARFITDQRAVIADVDTPADLARLPEGACDA